MFRKWGKKGRQRKTERDKYMTADELKRFLTASQEDGREYEALWRIQANLGLRISEALDLQRKDFSNISEGMVKVRTLKQKAIHGSGQAVDLVYVDDDTAKFIVQYLKSFPAQRKYLFQSGAGHLSRQAAWLAFSKAIARAGLNPSYSPHALRHYRGVVLWESTKDLQFVRSQLRHRSINSTSVYMHMSPKTQKALVRKVKSVL